MGTRSAIAVKHGNVVKAVYCHWDGYPDYNGRILNNYYQDSVKVNQLISLGDLSSLGANIGEQHSFDERAEYLESGLAKQCTFYGRDRGEEGIEFKTYQNEKEFIENFDMGQEYMYLYDNGVWYVRAYESEFIPLHEELAKLSEKEEA